MDRDRTVIFTAYNKMHKEYEPKRLNKGLGLALSTAPEKYSTNIFTCDCPDFLYRYVTCKHIIAQRLRLGLDGLIIGDQVQLLLQPEIFGQITCIYNGVADIVTPAGDWFTATENQIRRRC